MNIDVKIKTLNNGSSLPEYATDGSAAVDLRAFLTESVLLKPYELALIPTGIAVELPHKNVVAVICARSGLSTKYGITLANGIGVIDSDYRGQIHVSLRNMSDKDYTILPNDRIAQMMFIPVYTANFIKCDALEQTERGDGGFGSTGIK